MDVKYINIHTVDNFRPRSKLKHFDSNSNKITEIQGQSVSDTKKFARNLLIKLKQKFGKLKLKLKYQ